jgi:hypothetical protein|tara:strand:+ start:580 stop:705 length:126 start_codon:yes stop_codon:yes gene_type:complete
MVKAMTEKEEKIEFWHCMWLLVRWPLAIGVAFLIASIITGV